MTSYVTHSLAFIKNGVVKKSIDIKEVIESYQMSTNPMDRYTSFDYCYNYFKTNNNLTKDMEKSCLTLGFYLSSWGMYRGSSAILQRSVKTFEELIKYYDSLERNIWEIDADNYSDGNIEIILEVYAETRKLILPQNNSHLTLVTKILMGVFGFIPAFDRYFCSTFRDIFKAEKCGFTVVNRKSLILLRDFYQENFKEIDKFSSKTLTRDFISGDFTNINYSKSKIIDMYGFTKSYNKREIRKK